MKILHIHNADKFTIPFVNLINKNFNQGEHQFFVVDSFFNPKFKSKIKHNNLKYVYNKSFDFLTLIKCMNTSEKIIIHSLIIPNIILILFLQPWLLKKCYWVVWGGDLYAYHRQHNTKKAIMKESIRAFIIKRFGHIVTLVKDDFNLAKEWYDVKGKYYHGAYVNPISKGYLDTLSNDIKQKKNQIIIQIGNSADPANNHIDALKKLSKFKDENIVIYAPLSYGDKSNAKFIIEEGNRLFGDKFIPLTEFLPPKQYSVYLNNVDIAIFNNDRQQALGNIYALLFLNKKVYIRSDTSMWSHFKEKFDIDMNDFLRVEDLSFEKFTSIPELVNKSKIKCVFTDDYLVGIWQSIFND